MKDGEGVAEMYSRLTLITNEIAGLGSEQMTDRFIIKKILRALDGKYDTMFTLIQMMPNYKDLKPTEVIGRIVAHEMSLKDKEEQVKWCLRSLMWCSYIIKWETSLQWGIESNGEELQQVLQE